MLAGAPVSSRLSALQTPASSRAGNPRPESGIPDQKLRRVPQPAAPDGGAGAGRRRSCRRLARTPASGKRSSASCGPVRCLQQAGRGRMRRKPLAFVTSLESALDRAAASSPNPGRPAVHRLNRAEYANSIRDLLGVEVDVRTLLPADDADEHGFDNIADVLSVSPALLDRYMSAAKKVTRQALGRPLPGPAIQTYNVPRLLVQNARLSEDLPFGSRGGIAVRHAFPVDGEYSIKIKLQTNLYDYIRGIGRAHRLEVRVDGAQGRAVRGRRRRPRIAGARELRGRHLRQSGVGKIRARCRREPRGPLHRQGRHAARRRDVRRRAERGARRRPAAPSGVVSARHRRNALG